MFKLLLQDESGTQVVEYALVIAVISILLIVALQPLVTDTGISDLVDLVRTCLGGVDCGCSPGAFSNRHHCTGSRS